MDLRDKTLSLFRAAITAANPAQALCRAVLSYPPPAVAPGGGYIILAIGKVAVPMTKTMLATLGDAAVRALVITTYENAQPVPGARVIAAGHPVPDDNGIRAGQAVITLLASATAHDRVIALISGGGSALLPAPVPGLTLADKIAVNRLLLASGLDITGVNLIRQQLSQVKGGGMLRLAAPAPVTAYILSDVIGDDLHVIASGPTVAPIGTGAMARKLLVEQGLWPRLPPAVRAQLARPDSPDPLPMTTNHLIGGNRISLDAVAKAHGPGATIVNDRLAGDVAAAAKEIVAAAVQAPATASCLICGGETTVTVRGKGKGGRNQELALRVAMAMPTLGRDWVFLSGGTDGRDGPTDAAGGLVDAGTLPRIRKTGADPDVLLADNDSYHALALAGDLVVTGPTGTNVADVQILLLGPKT